MLNKIEKMVYFGGSDFSVIVLNELKKKGILPELIITTPDKPKGRKLILTPTPVKIWAKENNIETINPPSLKKNNENLLLKLKEFKPKFFVVASYGKIIPQEILDIPEKGTVNVHPSLLPKLRGASPIKSAILSENETGVSIMRLDADMDHGPIIFQEKILGWNDENVPYENDLQNILGQRGGQILADILPDWLDGKIKEKEQNHDQATFCGKIEKENGLLDLSSSPNENLRKIRAYHVWPGAYFFVDKNGQKLRVIVKKAKIENGELVMERVIPEGKKEMSWKDFLNGMKN